MQDILDIEKLEHTMITNWANFLNVRKLMAFAKIAIVEHHHFKETCTVQQLVISRFEFQSKGFTLWIEVNIQDVGKKVKATIEAVLSGNELNYVKSNMD